MLSLQTCVRAATLQNHSLILKTFFRKVRGLMSEGNILKGHAVKQTAEKNGKKKHFGSPGHGRWDVIHGRRRL